MLALLLGVTGCAGESGGSLTVYDASGGVLATANAVDDTNGFLRYTIDEAIGVLIERYDLTREEAEKRLFSGGYAIDSTADPTVMAAVEAAYGDQTMPFGCAVTDLSGKVLAVYSGGKEDFALLGHSPHSSIKPLSVYAPAMDEGLLDWSSTIEDKPYKKLKGEKGDLVDWPVNPTDQYTYQPVLLYDCLQQSLNTTAVHSLKTLGTEKALSFLQQSFGWDVSFEQEKQEKQGEEEILGNVALGTLYKGVTPIQLAGAYQIFGTGGRYEAPHAVIAIRDAEGKTVYTYQSEKTQVIREDTASIMNRLLKGVVSVGGTGVAAKAKGTELIGKTGTGTDDTDNWFVGVTPEYSCAIWHGEGNEDNIAAELFTKIFEQMPTPTKKTFAMRGSVKKVVLCTESGLQVSADCGNIKIGYYAANRVPAICDKH